MGVCEFRAPLHSTGDLEQGDILTGVLRPTPPVAGSIVPVQGANKIEFPPKPEHLARPLRENLRCISRVEQVELAIVLSNSCDNASGGHRLLLAPIQALRFRTTEAADQWRELSELATGTASPKYFYIAADSRFNVNRCEAILSDMFVLTHEFLQRCIDQAGTSRVCGLTPEAQRHLQWAIHLLFSRDPRDDFAWPSVEDLVLKKAWLERELTRGNALHDKYKADLDEVNRRLGEVSQPVSPETTPQT